MKKLFILSGTLRYMGTYEELANTMYGLHGKLDNDGNYRCFVSFPGRKWERGVSFVVVRGRVSFLFCRNVSPSGEDYNLTYKVYPATAALMFIVPLYMLLRAFIIQSDAFVANLSGFCFFSVIVLGVFLVTRHFAIRQFVKIIEENEKDDEGIFD